MYGDKTAPQPPDPYYERLQKLLAKCKEIECFEVGGEMYLGEIVQVVKSFIENNPEPADFETWVDMNYQRVSITKP